MANLPNIAGFRKKPERPDTLCIDTLTAGGRIIYRHARLSPSLCNRLAEIAGIGTQREV